MNILDLCVGFEINPVLRERLSLAQDKIDRLVEELAKCKDANGRLTNQVDELVRKLAEATIPKDFVEHRGIFFRRLDTGDYDMTVYCPTCRKPMASQEDFFNFACRLCRHESPFARMELVAEVHKSGSSD